MSYNTPNERKKLKNLIAIVIEEYFLFLSAIEKKNFAAFR